MDSTAPRMKGHGERRIDDFETIHSGIARAAVRGLRAERHDCGRHARAARAGKPRDGGGSGGCTDGYERRLDATVAVDGRRANGRRASGDCYHRRRSAVPLQACDSGRERRLVFRLGRNERCRQRRNGRRTAGELRATRGTVLANFDCDVTDSLEAYCAERRVCHNAGRPPARLRTSSPTIFSSRALVGQCSCERSIRADHGPLQTPCLATGMSYQAFYSIEAVRRRAA